MKKLFLFFVFLFSFFVYARPVDADLYVPPICKPDEEFIYSDNFNPKNYKKIRYAINQFGDFAGFCVNRQEYCSKNECDLQTKINQLGVTGFHLRAVLINFLINAFFVFLFYLLGHLSFKLFFKMASLGKILIISLLGYFADVIAISGTWFVMARFCFLPKETRVWWKNILCSEAHYDAPLEEILPAPITIVNFLVGMAIVFFLVSRLFYSIYSKQLADSKRKRWQYSIIFGILSNPLWYFLFRIIFL